MSEIKERCREFDRALDRYLQHNFPGDASPILQREFWELANKLCGIRENLKQGDFRFRINTKARELKDAVKALEEFPGRVVFENYGGRDERCFEIQSLEFFSLTREQYQKLKPLVEPYGFLPTKD